MRSEPPASATQYLQSFCSYALWEAADGGNVSNNQLLCSGELGDSNMERSDLSRPPKGHRWPLIFFYPLSPLLGQSTVLSGLDILDMLPENTHHYYSYQGSLTTPPCTENVHWFVLVHHVPLSSAQVRPGVTSLVSPLTAGSQECSPTPHLMPTPGLLGCFHARGSCASPLLPWVILPEMWQRWAR